MQPGDQRPDTPACDSTESSGDARDPCSGLVPTRAPSKVVSPEPGEAGQSAPQWPSRWWAEHECGNRRRCPHRMPLPEWWLLMAKRGIPFHPDVDIAMQMAKERIAVYRGSKPVLDEEARLVAQGIVLDALVVAPQPVERGWVNTSLSTVGGLVRWAQQVGEPLDRDYLLSKRTRDRFLNLGCRGIRDESVRNYRCRLDLIAVGLAGVPVGGSTTRTLKHSDPVHPHSPDDVATLWVWTQGVRPAKRRDRMVASVVLSLGCGLRSSELVHVRREDVSLDEHGVHVLVRSEDGGTRLVTCDEVWSRRLAAQVEATPPGHLLTSPWRRKAPTARALGNTLRDAQKVGTGRVFFSPRSLRNTWLVNRLTVGTPIPTLLDAAGVESIEALKGFLVYVPALSTAERARVLRSQSIPSGPAADGAASTTAALSAFDVDRDDDRGAR